MLKITRTSNGEVVFKLSGRMDAENVGDMEALLSAESSDNIIRSRFQVHARTRVPE